MFFKFFCIENLFCSFRKPTLTALTCTERVPTAPPCTASRKGSSGWAFCCICAAEHNRLLLRLWIYTHITATGMQACIFRLLSENGASQFLKINSCRAKAGINERESVCGNHQPCLLLVFTDSQALLSQPPRQRILSSSVLECQVHVAATATPGVCCEI